MSIRESFGIIILVRLRRRACDQDSRDPDRPLAVIQILIEVVDKGSCFGFGLAHKPEADGSPRTYWLHAVSQLRARTLRAVRVLHVARRLPYYRMLTIAAGRRPLHHPACVSRCLPVATRTPPPRRAVR